MEAALRWATAQVFVAMIGFAVLLTRQRDDIKPPSHQMLAVVTAVACFGCAESGNRRLRTEIARRE